MFVSRDHDENCISSLPKKNPNSTNKLTPNQKKTTPQSDLDFKGAQGRAGSHGGMLVLHINATNGFTHTQM